MALSKKPSKEIPLDALILTEEQAFTYQWKIVKSWQNKWETWSLLYGPGILGACSAVSAVYINNYYRKKLKLGNYGKMSSYLPIVALPAMMSAIYHKEFVQKSIVLQSDLCPVCAQVRAASFQASIGVLYPTLLAPLASFMFATRHYTFRLPSITEKPLEVLNLWRKMTKSLTPFLTGAVIIHMFLAMILTYKEMIQCYGVQNEMIRLEEKTREETGL